MDLCRTTEKRRERRSELPLSSSFARRSDASRLVRFGTEGSSHVETGLPDGRTQPCLVRCRRNLLERTILRSLEDVSLFPSSCRLPKPIRRRRRMPARFERSPIGSIGTEGIRAATTERRNQLLEENGSTSERDDTFTGAMDVRPPSKGSWKEEQDWDRLDKRKFFGYGSLLFGSVALGLFPLSVLKTRMMAGRDRSGPRNARLVLRSLYNEEGIKGLYRGLGTVMAGKIPSRFVYLGSLETFKSAAAKAVGDGWVSDAVAAGVVNFGAGAASSLVTQCIFVPVDVVSQRQMVDKALTHRPNGLRVFWDIWKNEGARGLYRGFGISVATFVPTSATWWGSYGMYQELLWNCFHENNCADLKVSEEDVVQTYRQGSDRAVVQALSGILAGSTAAFVTNPLDVVKTRLQVAPLEAGGKAPLVGKVIKNILEENGIRGMYKGVVPRMASMSLWGSCMISAYEVLKRISTIPTTST